MKESLQDAITEELPDADYPDFEPGDKIKVTQTKEIRGQQRKRHFEGVCIARRGEGPDETFKVRKVSFGVGVERIFPLYSPSIDSIEILRKGKVRRAKLNYLEGRSAKESRIEEERVDLEEVNRTEAAPEAEPDVEVEEEIEEDESEAAEDADETTDSSEVDQDVEPEEASDTESDEDDGKDD
jgi:large subunit ribosomal protein L19